MQRSFFMEQMRRNLKRVVWILAVLILALVVRLFWIQILGSEDLKQAACDQSLISLQGANTRGLIYDRNGLPMVADHKRYLYIIRKKDMDFQAAKLLASADAKETGSKGDYYVYSSRKYKKTIGKKLCEKYNAYILQASCRYQDHQTAANLIGYVNQGDSSGAAGLELMCDRQLSKSCRRLYAAADVKGNLLPGRGLIAESGKNGGRGEVRTTIDKKLQEEVEAVMAGYEDDCAVVVIKKSSGDVLAMACTPAFNPNDISGHIARSQNELLNKATQGEYAPGSVFKIVVAAAALEAGIPADQKFCCTGSVTLGSLEVRCKTGGEEGHGTIGMQEAFAQSCNSYFIQLGQRTGENKICEMAKKMGLGKRALKKYPQQSTGHVMTDQECSGAGIGNLSIGQGQMLVTPLQIARMTAIVASDGVDHGAHILLSEKTGKRRILSKDTARQIRSMMCRVTEEGTAQNMGLVDPDGSAAAAVKTGTAQYGRQEDGNSYGWLTGFTPCKNPEYIVTVFAGGSDRTASDAGPLYRRIVKYLNSHCD